MSEQTTERPAPKTTNADRTDTSPSVRSVAVGTITVAAVVAGIVVFVAGGWIAVAAAGGAAAVGTVAVARVRNPRPRRTGQSALATLLGRQKRTTTRTTGTKSWPLTGNQSRRAGGTGRKATGKGRGVGLPSITPKARARKAAAATGGKLGKSSTARPVAKAPARKGPGSSKPTGTKPPQSTRPRTPSKTPARPASRPALKVLPGGKGKTAPVGAGRSKPRLSTTPSRRTGGVSPVRRTGSGTGRKASRPGGVTKPGKVFRKMSPRPTTGGKRLGGTGSRGPVSRAKRLGTPGVRQRTTGAAKRLPNRTVRRPNPHVPATNRKLAGTALRVPRRQGWKVTRPSKAEQRKARRTLQLRSKLAGRRALGKVAGFPKWLWNHKPVLRLWPVMPSPIQQGWLIPNTPEPRLTTHRKSQKRRNPVPALTARRAPNQEVKTVSNPTEAVIEAYAQLSQFDPENARAIEGFLGSLGHMHTESAASLSAMAAAWQSEQPLAAQVLEMLQQVASAHAGIADLADEANQAFATAHAKELERLNEPRAGEQKWDVTQNQ